MNAEQALNVLSQATEPGVKLTRQDYIIIQQALNVLAEAIKSPVRNAEAAQARGGTHEEKNEKNAHEAHDDAQANGQHDESGRRQAQA